MKFILRKYGQNFWPYLLIILVIALPWFLKPGYLFFTDTVWGPIINLDWRSSWFLFNLIIKALSFVFSVAFLEKVFISLVLILVLLGGRKLVSEIIEFQKKPDDSVSNSSGLVFVLSLFALFNPFVYDRALYGQFGIIIAYGFLLLTLAYLLKVWRTLDFKDLIYTAICSALVFMFSLHFIFFLAPFYLLFLIGLYLKRKDIKAGNLNKKFYRYALVALFIVLILNANWLYALISGASPTASFVSNGISTQDLSAFATSGNTPAETFSNVLLMSGFWGKDQLRYLDLTEQPGWQRSFIFLLPIIFYGVFLSFRKRPRTEKILSASLLIIFALAVILAVGIKSPLTSSLTVFLYNHLPYYKGLREPQKWVAVIIPIYLFYLTLGAARLRQAKFISENKILSAFVLAAIIIMGAPSLVWGFNRQVKALPYPEDWSRVDKFLMNRAAQSYGCSDRILFLPWHLYLGFSWSGKIMANPASAFFTCPVKSGTNMEWGGIYDNSQDSEGQAVEAWLAEQGKFQSPLFSGTSTNSIHYVVLAKDSDFTTYLWLNNVSYLHLILETPTLLVYEIKS
jgi:hypothetical protein